MCFDHISMFYWLRYFEVLWFLVKITKSYHLDRNNAITRNAIVFSREVFQYWQDDDWLKKFKKSDLATLIILPVLPERLHRYCFRPKLNCYVADRSGPSWKQSVMPSCTGRTLHRGSSESFSVRWKLRRQPSFSPSACLPITWQMSHEGTAMKRDIEITGRLASGSLILSLCKCSEHTVWFSLTKMVKNEKITNSLTKTKTKTKKWWKLKRN